MAKKGSREVVLILKEIQVIFGCEWSPAKFQKWTIAR
jgi:hypothetical protein